MCTLSTTSNNTSTTDATATVLFPSVATAGRAAAAAAVASSCMPMKERLDACNSIPDVIAALRGVAFPLQPADVAQALHAIGCTYGADVRPNNRVTDREVDKAVPRKLDVSLTVVRDTVHMLMMRAARQRAMGQGSLQSHLLAAHGAVGAFAAAYVPSPKGAAAWIMQALEELQAVTHKMSVSQAAYLCRIATAARAAPHGLAVLIPDSLHVAVGNRVACAAADELDTATAVILAEALAGAGVQHEPAVAAACSAAVATAKRLRKLAPTHAISLLWSSARLNHVPLPLLQAMNKKPKLMLSTPPRRLATALWSLAVISLNVGDDSDTGRLIDHLAALGITEVHKGHKGPKPTFPRSASPATYSQVHQALLHARLGLFSGGSEGEAALAAAKLPKIIKAACAQAAQRNAAKHAADALSLECKGAVRTSVWYHVKHTVAEAATLEHLIKDNDAYLLTDIKAWNVAALMPKHKHAIVEVDGLVHFNRCYPNPPSTNAAAITTHDDDHDAVSAKPTSLIHLLGGQTRHWTYNGNTRLKQAHIRALGYPLVSVPTPVFLAYERHYPGRLAEYLQRLVASAAATS